jgi:hypothetical protein
MVEQPETAAPAEGPAQEDAGGMLQRFSWSDTWIENFPVLNGVTCLIAIGVGLAAVGTLYALEYGLLPALASRHRH